MKAVDLSWWYKALHLKPFPPLQLCLFLEPSPTFIFVFLLTFCPFNSNYTTHLHQCNYRSSLHVDKLFSTSFPHLMINWWCLYPLTNVFSTKIKALVYTGTSIGLHKFDHHKEPFPDLITQLVPLYILINTFLILSFLVLHVAHLNMVDSNMFNLHYF